RLCFRYPKDGLEKSFSDYSTDIANTTLLIRDNQLISGSKSN
ncbi:MAG: hypothetical protein ACI85F_002195, partial [Bacteroidia bacterium]